MRHQRRPSKHGHNIPNALVATHNLLIGESFGMEVERIARIKPCQGATPHGLQHDEAQHTSRDRRPCDSNAKAGQTPPQRHAACESARLGKVVAECPARIPGRSVRQEICCNDHLGHGDKHKGSDEEGDVENGYENDLDDEGSVPDIFGTAAGESEGADVAVKETDEEDVGEGDEGEEEVGAIGAGHAGVEVGNGGMVERGLGSCGCELGTSVDQARCKAEDGRREDEQADERGRDKEVALEERVFAAKPESTELIQCHCAVEHANKVHVRPATRGLE
ncbi:hypothetical protein M8818_002853 [Zalaria obscura]|uniref:Uncharacterized protein n=1 Tax=Zalaria obscura TaxID=2024903 RepID=A0ACC3SJ38_9PEZI